MHHQIVPIIQKSWLHYEFMDVANRMKGWSRILDIFIVKIVLQIYPMTNSNWNAAEITSCIKSSNWMEHAWGSHLNLIIGNPTCNYDFLLITCSQDSQ